MYYVYINDLRPLTRTQGACVASIKPEYLMELNEYKAWVRLQKELEAKRNKSGRWEIKAKTEEEEAIEVSHSYIMIIVYCLMFT